MRGIPAPPFILKKLMKYFSSIKLILSRNTVSMLVACYLLILNIVGIFQTQSTITLTRLQHSLSFILITFLIFSLFSLHKIIFKVILIIFICITSVTIFYRMNYNAVITMEIIQAIFINDFSLTKEMLSEDLMIWFIFTALLPSFFIFFLKLESLKITRTIIQKTVAACGLIGLLFLTNVLNETKRSIKSIQSVYLLYTYSPIDFIASFAKYIKTPSELYSEAIVDIGKKYDFKLSQNSNDQKVVIVIGESARADRFSLNGYDKNTNPRLETRRNLISFSNVEACDTTTFSSVLCLLTRKTRNGTYIPETALTSIFKKLNFELSIYSLHTINGFYKYLGYDNIKTKYAILVNSGEKKLTDGLLIPYLKNATQRYGNQLIILHTLGSHSNYNNRYPDNFRFFKNICKKNNIKSCSREQIDASYDNSIRYTDYFLNSIISLLENKNAILFYISDHGESLGENGQYFHGIPINRAPAEQVRVPFIIWMSDKYLKNNEKKRFLSQLQRKKDHPILHDNFFYTVLGCSGISDNGGIMIDKLDLCKKN